MLVQGIRLMKVKTKVQDLGTVCQSGGSHCNTRQTNTVRSFLLRVFQYPLSTSLNPITTNVCHQKMKILSLLHDNKKSVCPINKYSKRYIIYRGILCLRHKCNLHLSCTLLVLCTSRLGTSHICQTKLQ